MWSKVLSSISALLSTASPLVYIACAVAGFAGGVYITADHYKGLMAKLSNEHLLATKAEQDKYARRLSEATSALVDAHLANRRLSDSNADMRRRLLVADSREDTRVQANPEISYRTEYTSCRKLLTEGVELLHEGDELVRELATDKDALANLVK